MRQVFVALKTAAPTIVVTEAQKRGANVRGKRRWGGGGGRGVGVNNGGGGGKEEPQQVELDTLMGAVQGAVEADEIGEDEMNGSDGLELTVGGSGGGSGGWNTEGKAKKALDELVKAGRLVEDTIVGAAYSELRGTVTCRTWKGIAGSMKLENKEVPSNRKVLVHNGDVTRPEIELNVCKGGCVTTWCRTEKIYGARTKAVLFVNVRADPSGHRGGVCMFPLGGETIEDLVGRLGVSVGDLDKVEDFALTGLTSTTTTSRSWAGISTDLRLKQGEVGVIGAGNKLVVSVRVGRTEQTAEMTVYPKPKGDHRIRPMNIGKGLKLQQGTTGLLFVKYVDFKEPCVYGVKSVKSVKPQKPAESSEMTAQMDKELVTALNTEKIREALKGAGIFDAAGDGVTGELEKMSEAARRTFYDLVCAFEVITCADGESAGDGVEHGGDQAGGQGGRQL